MNEKSDDRSPVWQPTEYQHVFRYVPSGTIFARFKIRGKQLRKSLETASPELANNKLSELERNERVVAEENRRGKALWA